MWLPLAIALALGRGEARGADAAAPPAPTAEPAAAAGPASVGTPAAPPSADELAADVPPPTPYDAQRQGPSLLPEDRSLIGALWRTVLALALVVLLIYAAARLALPRLLPRLPQRQGTTMRLLERLPLDPGGKHSLVLVEVADGTRLVVGMTEGSVSLVTELAGPPSGSFASSLGDDRQEGRTDAKAN